MLRIYRAEGKKSFCVQQRKYPWKPWKRVAIPWTTTVEDISKSNIKVYLTSVSFETITALAQMYKNSLKLQHGVMGQLDKTYYFITYGKKFTQISAALDYEHKKYTPRFSRLV